MTIPTSRMPKLSTHNHKSMGKGKKSVLTKHQEHVRLACNTAEYNDPMILSSNIPCNELADASTLATTALLSTTTTTTTESGSALLNNRIANAVSSISHATRLSLNCSAFLVECFFEGAKYGTQTGLDISRRALVAAVSSARDIHRRTLLSSDDTSNGGQNEQQNVMSTVDDPFYQVLDKYTNLGIYYIHSAFSLAELFTLTGVHLTASTITQGLRAADESVRIIDGLFGSTELENNMTGGQVDPAVERLAKAGTIRTMAGILRALMAYACLQAVTWRRRRLDSVAVLIHECEVIDGVCQSSSGRANERTIVTSVESYEENCISNNACGTANGSMHIDDCSNLSNASFVTCAYGEMDDDASIMTTTTVMEQEILWELESMVNDLAANTNDGAPNGINTEMTTTKTTTTTTTTKTMKTKKAAAAPSQDTHNNLSGGTYRKQTISRRVSLEDLCGSDTKYANDEHSIHVTEATQDTEIHTSADHKSATIRHRRRRTSVTSMASVQGQALSGNNTSYNDDSAMESSVVVEELPEDFEIVPSQHDYTPCLQISSKQPQVLEPSDNESNSVDTSIIEYLHDDHDKLVNVDAQSKSDNSRSLRGLGNLLGSVNSAFAKKTKKVRVKMGGNKLTSSNTAVTSNDDNQADTSRSKGKHAKVLPSNRKELLPTITSKSTNDDVSDRQCQSDARATTIENDRQLVVKPPLAVERTSNPTHAAGSTNTAQRKPAFPQMSLINSAQRFMHYASAAYGPGFLNLLGMARHQPLQHLDSNHPANHAAFARHIGIPLSDVVHSSYTRAHGAPLLNLEPQMHSLVNYVCIDRVAKAIVLTLRGTLGLSDILTDLTCSYAELTLNGRRYHTHSGMLESARLLADPNSEVAQQVMMALRREPNFGLIICGHSLGGGVAALLALLWSEVAPNTESNDDDDGNTNTDTAWPPSRRFVTAASSPLPTGRPIRCFAYASPCVADTSLLKYARGLVTTIVHGHDIVPTLSLGVLHDFKAISVSLYAEHKLAEDIIARCIGLRNANPSDDAASSKLKKQPSNPSEPGMLKRAQTMPNHISMSSTSRNNANSKMFDGNQRQLDQADWYWSLIKTLQADMTARKLYPPGDVYVVESSQEHYLEKGDDKPRNCIRARMMHVLRVEERFGELIFAKRMLSDHAPTGYERCLDALASDNKSSLDVSTTDDRSLLVVSDNRPKAHTMPVAVSRMESQALPHPSSSSTDLHAINDYSMCMEDVEMLDADVRPLHSKGDANYVHCTATLLKPELPPR
ncbi:hypothetical protein BDF22DRAFT_740746 [Syncephalis plumigaleata]|nr:hypothetical protein BDF22DRAFT_740746 [Syncephalis plumigaleata]